MNVTVIDLYKLFLRSIGALFLVGLTFVAPVFIIYIVLLATGRVR
jgi:hypothetical protein